MALSALQNIVRIPYSEKGHSNQYWNALVHVYVSQYNAALLKKQAEFKKLFRLFLLSRIIPFFLLLFQ